MPSLSKQTRRRIKDFLKAASPQYHKSYKTPVDSYVKAYESTKGPSLDSTPNQVG